MLIAACRNREHSVVMAQLIDWHWREGKPAAWEFFSLADKNDEQLLDERKAVSGLVFWKEESESKREGYSLDTASRNKRQLFAQARRCGTGNSELEI